MSDARELSVTRLIDAPLDGVWDIATRRMAEWWCPAPGRPRSSHRIGRPVAGQR